MASDTPRPDHVLQAGALSTQVQQAIQSLPERQREALLLCHFEELGNIEAAAVLDISVEALESLLGRARRSLRSSLAELRQTPQSIHPRNAGAVR
jgi:RNA polymerase sigma-70 factor (ECF subfamily)